MSRENRGGSGTSAASTNTKNARNPLEDAKLLNSNSYDNCRCSHGLTVLMTVAAHATLGA